MKRCIERIQRSLLNKYTVQCLACGAIQGEFGSLKHAERAFDAHQAARKQAAEVGRL